MVAGTVLMISANVCSKYRYVVWKYMSTFKEKFSSFSSLKAEELDSTTADWKILEEIFQDHLANEENLKSIAQACAGLLQGFPEVHSVRWRVKSAYHLIDKIIRKIKKNPDKYNGINAENYFAKITDLVGLRVLHLFKSSSPIIHEWIKKSFKFVEKPVIYIRSGDGTPDELKSNLDDKNISVEVHPEGYRSWHYIISNQLFLREVFSEVQVRTIYEEAWSEIDHKLKYPHGCPEQVSELLLILNRISGTADEMGDSIARLGLHLRREAQLKSEIEKARDDALAKAEALSMQLEQGGAESAPTKEKLGALQDALLALKRQERSKFENLLNKNTSFNLDRSLPPSGLAARLGFGSTSNYLNSTAAELAIQGRIPLGLDTLLGEKHKGRGWGPGIHYDPLTGEISAK